MVAFYADYDAQCNREGVVDFAELLLRTFETAGEEPEPAARTTRTRFRYILVDEFQDTNKLQYKWIKMLAGSNGCVFAVGDDDQCLPAGTLVTMADGSRKPIEAVAPAIECCRATATEIFRAAAVERSRISSHARRRPRRDHLARPSASLVSTPEHTHFAARDVAELALTRRCARRPVRAAASWRRRRVLSECRGGTRRCPGMSMLELDGSPDPVAVGANISRASAARSTTSTSSRPTTSSPTAWSPTTPSTASAAPKSAT